VAEKRYALALDLPATAKCACSIEIDGRRLLVVAQFDDLDAAMASAKLAFTGLVPPTLHPDHVCVVDRSSGAVAWSRALG
jgi:hypothetical protein